MNAAVRQWRNRLSARVVIIIIIPCMTTPCRQTMCSISGEFLLKSAFC